MKFYEFIAAAILVVEFILVFVLVITFIHK